MNSRGRFVLPVIIAALGCSSAELPLSTHLIRIEPGSIRAIQTEARFLSVWEIIAGEGAVWVLDRESPHITRVNLKDGAALQVGEEGGGPGEVRNPRSMQLAGGGLIRVWDFGTGRVLSFDSLGTFRGSEHLNADSPVMARLNISDVSYVDPFRIRVSGDSVLFSSFSRGMTSTADFSSGTLRIADFDLAPGPELIRFNDHVRQGLESQLEWAAVPLWDARQDLVALWSPVLSQVIWMDGGGNRLATVEVDWPEIEISRKDIERYLRRMARLELGAQQELEDADITRMARAVRDRFAEIHPGPVELRLGTDGVIWLRLFDTTTDPLGKGRRWLRISRKGDQEAYEFPETFVPMAFLADGAYGVSRLQEGDQVLAWWSRSAPVHELESK